MVMVAGPKLARLIENPGGTAWTFFLALSPPPAAPCGEVTTVLIRSGLLLGCLVFGPAGSAQVQDWSGIEGLYRPAAYPFGAEASFGSSLDVSGDWLVIGSYGGDSVHLYRRETTGWEFAQSIRGPLSSFVGNSFAIEGDALLVGLRVFGAPGPERGRVWVFTRDGEEWIHRTSLDAPDLEDGSFFGYSVALHGDLIAVGAPKHAVVGGYQGGAVVLFERTQNGWEQAATIPWEPCCNGAAGTSFAFDGWMGWSVAVWDGVVVAGAPVSEHGQVYTFEKDPAGAWRRTASILDPSPEISGRFGHDVALEGGTLVVGRHRPSSPGFLEFAGSAYVFHRQPGGAWDLAQTLQASDGHGGGDHGDEFGRQVEILNGRIVVSAPRHDGDEPLDGKVYVFEQDAAGVWKEVRHITSPRGQLETGFGQAMTLSSQHVFSSRINDVSARFFVYATELPIGEVFCDAASHELSLLGVESLATNEIELVAFGVGAGWRSAFLMGTERVTPPLGSGSLCIGPTPTLLGPVRVIEEGPRVVQALDLAVPPLVGVAFPGSTLTFQHWTQRAGSLPQLSNAVGIELAQ